MAVIMRPLSFSNFLNRIYREGKNHSGVFGISETGFFRIDNGNAFNFFGTPLENPIGPAAGPHTQMTQNIISGYLTGGRFFELKTVQKNDQLNIGRPCIDMEDEGYNVEWSQELRLEESYDEYLKAWILNHFIKEYMGLSSCKESGFIFNMSVGYDLEGIKSGRMNDFIDKMMRSDKSESFFIYKNILKEFIKNNLRNRDELIESAEMIPPVISNSVTLSTMHGCPPDEIESIVKYLIKEKGLHTYVKLNPTLLGYDFVKYTLDNLGYKKVILEKHSFDKDLQWNDAVLMVRRLKSFAKENGKEFGIKLSNTLPVLNIRKRMPGDEMYLSGRPLFPLTINLVSKIAEEFAGDINISYSGGASINNIKEIIETGIKPVTFASELLKPGGYNRLFQISESIRNLQLENIEGIDLQKLKALAAKSLYDKYYKKESRTTESIKVPDKLNTFDCFIAPCKVACPIHQDVPEYIRLAGDGKYEEALQIITDKNPLPHITGYVCDHQCMFHCTRIDYDEAVRIRDIKKEAALNGYSGFVRNISPEDTGDIKIKAAVIGAGPSGLSAAYFLAKSGLDVTVFEKNMNAGGIVQNILPQFRLPQSAIDNDIKFIEKFGVRFIFGVDQSFSVNRLKQEGYKYIYISIGAGKSNKLEITTDREILNAIDFLWNYHHNIKISLGKSVAVIGGGNSAMDSARAALRLEGVENVYLIYRRTKEYMPADREEFEAALSDGVNFKELLLPADLRNGKLICNKMKLSEPEPDGRRSVIPIDGEYEILEIDTVISAIGESVDTRLLQSNKIIITNNKAAVNPLSNETNIENVFIGGDALNGPATIVRAIADGRKAADAILKKENMAYPQIDMNKYTGTNKDAIKLLKGKIEWGRRELAYEASRCLSCNSICNKCVDVCPNRANVEIVIDHPAFRDANQILHIDSLCNECGNCETFCPHEGAPYKDKFTLFSSEDDFNQSGNDGFYIIKAGKEYGTVMRAEGRIYEINDIHRNNGNLNRYLVLMKSVIEDYPFLVH